MKFIPILFLFLSCSFSNPTGTKEEVFKWIYEHYIYEYDDKDYWQSPEETLERGIGDCEDWAILAIYMLKEINIEARFAAVQSDEYADNYFHACIEIDGTIYETRGGGLVDMEKYHVAYLWTYEEVMFLRIFYL